MGSSSYIAAVKILSRLAQSARPGAGGVVAIYIDCGVLNGLPEGGSIVEPCGYNARRSMFGCTVPTRLPRGKLAVSGEGVHSPLFMHRLHC